jgi:hypothetical protein
VLASLGAERSLFENGRIDLSDLEETVEAVSVEPHVGRTF